MYSCYTPEREAVMLTRIALYSGGIDKNSPKTVRTLEIV